MNRHNSGGDGRNAAFEELSDLKCFRFICVHQYEFNLCSAQGQLTWIMLPSRQGRVQSKLNRNDADSPTVASPDSRKFVQFGRACVHEYGGRTNTVPVVLERTN